MKFQKYRNTATFINRLTTEAKARNTLTKSKEL